jgi:2',3'-cyclic-nucleotide 2'-phosphodiesterase (5'-nucleotidase family)
LSPTFSAAAVLLIAAAFIAPARGATSAPAVDVLFTSETGFQPLPCRCQERPLGGWAQRAVVLDSLRALASAPLVLDAGGWLGGNVDAETARLTGEAHAQMGYAALNVGPAELHLLRNAVVREGAAALPLVCGHPERPSGIPAYRVTEVGGRRVGIIGAARFEPTAPTPAEQVASAIAEMPATDLVVVLLAGGLGPMNTIADTHDSVDVVLYGDGAKTTAPVVRRRTIAAAPGTRGRYVGRLVLGARGAEIEVGAYELVPVDKRLRGSDDLVKLALRAAELKDGPKALREATFTYVAE